MAGGAFGVGHAAPTLVEQHALWAAFAPVDQAVRSWTVLIAGAGLDGIPPGLGGLLPRIAHNLEEADDVPFAGHLAGFRRRCLLTAGLASTRAESVLGRLDGLDVCVVGDLAVVPAVPGGTHPVPAILLWLPHEEPAGVARRLDLPTPSHRAGGLVALTGDGPVPVHLAPGPPPYLGPPARPIDVDRWWSNTAPLCVGGRQTAALGPTEALLHTWVGIAWRPDRARAAADIHLLVDRDGVDLEELVDQADEAGVAGVLRTSLPYLGQVFGAAPYARVERLLAWRRRHLGEQAVRWLDRPLAGVGPAPHTVTGYFGLLPAGAVPGRHGLGYLRRRRALAGAGTPVGESLRRMGRPASGVDRAVAALARRVALDDTTALTDLDPPIGELDADRFLERVEWHRLEGVAAAELVDEPIAPLLEDRLRLARHRARRAHLAALAELRHATEVLDLPFLVVKGPVLAGLYGQAGARSYGDLDLLVGDDDFEQAHQALLAADYRPTIDPDTHAGAFAQVPYLRPGGVEIDLHRSLLASAHRRSRAALSTATLMQRSVVVRLGGDDHRTLDPADTAVHVAAHGATSGADRLIWLVDLAVALAVDGVGDDLVVERAGQWQAGPDLAFMLIRLAAVLRVAVRPDLVERLESSAGFDRMARLAVRVFPAERTSGRFTPARHLATHARPTATATTAAMVADQLRRGGGLLRALSESGGGS